MFDASLCNLHSIQQVKMYPCKAEGCKKTIKSFKRDGTEWEYCFPCGQAYFGKLNSSKKDPSTEASQEVFGICAKDGCNETTAPMKSNPKQAYRYCDECTNAGKLHFGMKDIAYRFEKLNGEILELPTDVTLSDLDKVEEDLDKIDGYFRGIRSYLAARKEAEPLSKRRRTK